MGRYKLIDSPETMWELPLPKNQDGEYIVIPKKKGYSGITTVNKRNNPNGYIYFIKSQGFDFYKLGVSAKADRRLKDIDSYLPFEIEILSIHYFENVYDVESEISKMIKHLSVRKEWYKMDIDTANGIMIHLHNLNVKQDGSVERK